MRSFLSTASAAILAASLCSAQTFTSCDPTKKSCPANPAIGTPFTSDFTQGAAALSGWTITAGALTYNSDGAQFTINKRGDAPTIQTNGYLFFGYVEVKMKAASGQGIVSSVVLESDDLDEVDWEFLGTTTTNVQTNYFGKGNTTTYDRMIPYNVASPQTTSHTFALNWTADSLVWLIDGVAQRTLHYADAVGGKNYPQTPMNLRIGIWAGGDPDNSPGTISWAGGKTDYTKAPFTMSVESVKIINYSPGTEYQYSDMTGDWQSIKVIGAGNSAGGADNATISAGVSGGLSSIVEAGPTSTVTGAFSAPSGGHGNMTAGPAGPSTTGTADGSDPGCSCGIATVYVTAIPGESAAPSSPPTTLIPVPSAAQSSASVVLPTTSGVPPVAPSSAAGTPLSSAVPETTPAPYSAAPPSGGLLTDTDSAPGVPSTTVPLSSSGTGAFSNGTVTSATGVPQFTGAASRVALGGAFWGVAFGAAGLAVL